MHVSQETGCHRHFEGGTSGHTADIQVATSDVTTALCLYAVILVAPMNTHTHTVVFTHNSAMFTEKHQLCARAAAKVARMPEGASFSTSRREGKEARTGGRRKSRPGLHRFSKAGMHNRSRVGKGARRAHRAANETS